MRKIILSALLLALVTFGIPMSANAEQKIAVIDIQKVVEQSAQIQALNKEQEKKIKELEKWIATVQKDVEKQQTQEGKEKLFNKYKSTYIKKRDDIVKSGQEKMQVIMDNISKTIASQAQAKGYDMVITKSIVVYGGEDITEDVQKALK